MAMEDATLIKRRNPAFVLRALANEDEYVLQGEMLVGREVECAIALNSGHISRYHAKINVSPNGVYIEDLHSTNGTFVNGQKIKGRIRLSVGDEVAFDDITFRLTSNASGSAVDTALSPRRHAQAETSFQPVATSRPYTPAKPVRPSLVSSRPNYTPDLNKVDELLNSTPGAGRFAEPAQPRPAAVEPPAPAPAARESAPPGTDSGDGEHTQFLSAAQLDRLVERGRMDQDLNVGSGPRLIVMTAPLRGKLFELRDAPLGTNWQIGRDTNSEICLNDKTISNDHARLAKSADGYLLVATHAKNGILVNGFAKPRAFLNHNDKIQIGRTELVFKTDESYGTSATSVVDKSAYDGQSMRRYSIAVTLVALVVLVGALFATAH
ncbi:MAG: FHA domain-containing protein [Cellvibrionaceae bacterium]|nr:FHA domain-containing protein [Cellvibrionaceae bacterium]